MIAYLAAGPAACNTGSWQQRWDCGWNQPTTTAANAGYLTGHTAAPVLLGLLIVVLIIAIARRRRSSSRAASRRYARNGRI